MSQMPFYGDWISFMQSSFETTVNTMNMLQDQGEKILNSVLDQGLVAQKEGRKILGEWIEMSKKGRDDYGKMVKENLDNMNELFNSVKPPKAK